MFSREHRRRSNWGLASVLPHRWAAVFVNTSVAVGRDWGRGGTGGTGGGWVDCNGTCSHSNYPWTLEAAEDLLGPSVAFIIIKHAHTHWGRFGQCLQRDTGPCMHPIKTFVTPMSPVWSHFITRCLKLSAGVDGILIN